MASQPLRSIAAMFDGDVTTTPRTSIGPRPVNVTDVLADVLPAVRAKASAKGLSLEVDHGADVPSTILFDAERLRQIFNHLLSNAVKFTHRGYVRLSLAADRRNAATADLLVVVEDSGIGFDFEAAERVRAALGNEGAEMPIGPGLASLRNLVADSFGQIEMASAPGAGTRFNVVLPVLVCQSPASVLSDAPSPLRGATVLLAASAADERARLRHHLEPAGARVIEAGKPAHLEHLDAQIGIDVTIAGPGPHWRVISKRRDLALATELLLKARPAMREAWDKTLPQRLFGEDQQAIEIWRNAFLQALARALRQVETAPGDRTALSACAHDVAGRAWALGALDLAASSRHVADLACASARDELAVALVAWVLTISRVRQDFVAAI